MEFFYGYPDEAQTVRFIAGTDAIQRADRTYDPKTGRPHEVQRNIAVCRQFGMAATPVVDWWARTLTFDALIGNTDRHAENWGLLRGGRDESRATPEWVMAPAFDHGTSLGYEILEKDLQGYSEAAAIEKHILKGRHHCTWETTVEKRGEAFFSLCEKLCVAYPRIRDLIGRMIPVEDAPIGEIVSHWVNFDLPVKFSAARATFVERLIRARRNTLATRLGL